MMVQTGILKKIVAYSTVSDFLYQRYPLSLKKYQETESLNLLNSFSGNSAKKKKILDLHPVTY